MSEAAVERYTLSDTMSDDFCADTDEVVAEISVELQQFVLDNGVITREEYIKKFCRVAGL